MSCTINGNRRTGSEATDGLPTDVAVLLKAASLQCLSVEDADPLALTANLSVYIPDFNTSIGFWVRRLDEKSYRIVDDSTTITPQSSTTGAREQPSEQLVADILAKLSGNIPRINTAIWNASLNDRSNMGVRPPALVLRGRDDVMEWLVAPPGSDEPDGSITVRPPDVPLDRKDGPTARNREELKTLGLDW